MSLVIVVLLLVLAVAVYARHLREAGWLIILRLAVVLLLALIFLDRVVAFRWTEKPSRVAVMIDRSLSMTVGGADTQALTAARRFPLLHSAKPEFWVFGDTVLRMPTLAAVGNESHDSAGQSDVLRRTRIGAALRAVARSRPGAVVLISDGRDNGETDPVKVAQESRIPVYAVGCGPTGERNMELVRLSIPPAAYVGDTVSVTARVRYSGFDNERAVLRLGRRTVMASLGNETAEQDFPFVVVFDRPGRTMVQLQAESLPGEANYADNTIEAGVEVLSGRVKVAYVTNRPGLSTRFVTRVLRDQPRAELVEEAADIYVIDGIDEGASGVPLQEIAGRVKNGAGALILAGPDFRPGAVLAELLPGGKGVNRKQGSFAPALTGVGRTFSWLDGITADAVPPFGLVFEPQSNDAEVWLASREPAAPLVMSYKAGRGRVVYVAGSPVWRWGFGSDVKPGRSPLELLLSGVVRYLVEQGKERFSLHPVRPAFYYGEPVVLTLTARASDGSAWAGLDAAATVDSGSPVPMREMAPGSYEVELTALDSGEHRVTAVVKQNDSVLGRAETSIAVSGRELELVRTGLNRDLLAALASASGGDYFRWDSLPQEGFEMKTAVFQRGFGFEPRRAAWVYVVVALLVGVELVLRRRRGLL